MKSFYVVYDKHENAVCVGSVEECTKFLNVTVDTFYCMVTRTKNGQLQGNSYLVYKFEEEGIN